MKTHRHKIYFKPLTIIVPNEREALFKKLKAHKAEVDLIIENPDVDVKLKLKAMDMSVKITKVMAGVLTTIQAAEITAEIAKLKKLMDEMLEEDKHENQRTRFA